MDPEKTILALHDAGVEFVVIGGVAMGLQGSAHLTKDIDFCYERTPKNMERLARAMGPGWPTNRSKFQRFERDLLRGEQEFAGKGGFGGAATEGLLSANAYHVGIIVFLGNVREDQIAGAPVETFRVSKVFADCMIGEMTGARENALLDYPGIRTDLQHFQIVIGFQHQAIGFAQMNFHQLGHVAEIGNDGHFGAVRTEGEADRVGSIVRNRECVHVNIADGEMLAGMNRFDTAQTFFQPFGKRTFQRCERQLSDEQRGSVETKHLGQAVAMVGVFVSNEDAVDVIH